MMNVTEEKNVHKRYSRSGAVIANREGPTDTHGNGLASALCFLVRSRCETAFQRAEARKQARAADPSQVAGTHSMPSGGANDEPVLLRAHTRWQFAVHATPMLTSLSFCLPSQTRPTITPIAPGPDRQARA